MDNLRTKAKVIILEKSSYWEGKNFFGGFHSNGNIIAHNILRDAQLYHFPSDMEYAISVLKQRKYTFKIVEIGII